MIIKNINSSYNKNDGNNQDKKTIIIIGMIILTIELMIIMNKSN